MQGGRYIVCPNTSEVFKYIKCAQYNVCTNTNTVLKYIMCTLYTFCTNTIDVLTYILYTIYIFCTTTNDVLWHIFCTFRTYFVLVHYKMMPPFYVPYVLPCTLVQKRWQQYIKCTLFFLSVGYGVSHTEGVKVVQVHRHTFARKCHRYLVPGNVDNYLKHDMKFG